VVLQPPQLSEIDTWQGAFISSTSRLLLPACEVQYEQPHGQHRTKVRGRRSGKCVFWFGSQWVQ